MQVLEILNTVVNNFPVEGVVGVITGSSLLTPITRKLKNQSDLFKMTLVWCTFAVGAGIYYLLNTPIDNPTIIAIQASVLYVASQPFYMKVAKPIAVWFGDQLAKAAAFDEQVKQAKEPVTQDFSN